MSLTKCGQLVSVRRVEPCIACAGPQCPCCNGTGNHPSAGAKNARDNIRAGFVENQRVWAKDRA